MSQLISVNCSIPQGSVFSPVEFITYTEDVVTVFKKHRVRYQLYADDIQAYVDALIQDIDQAWYTLQHCVTDISSWCSSRRLQLNTDNTKLIWFGSRVSSCRKFLGVTLSYSLTPASSNRSK